MLSLGFEYVILVLVIFGYFSYFGFSGICSFLVFLGVRVLVFCYMFFGRLVSSFYVLVRLM